MTDYTPTQPKTQQPTDWDITRELLAALHTGGAWGFYWTYPGKVSTWWPVGDPAPAPNAPNVYFGVHPTSQIPPTNSKGKPAPPAEVRSQNAFIAAVNCLFAEFDQKDGATRELINTLSPVPSVVITSGGGWHCYWLLTEPFIIRTDEDREKIRNIQAAWVKLQGGDKNAKDLARVLRLPGTHNGKYDPPPLVDYVWIELNLRHELDSLAFLAQVVNAAGEDHQAAPTKPQAGHNAPRSEKLGDYILRQAIVKAPGGRNDTGFWLACQLRDNHFTQAEAEAIMQDYAHQVTARGDHPYDESEARASLREAYAAPARDPWQSRPSGNGYHASEAAQVLEAPAAEPDEPPTKQGYLTDTGNAERLAARYGKRLRWVSEWGWLVWDGKRWQRDREGRPMRWAKDTAKSIYQEAAATEDDNTARSLASWASKSLNRTRLEAMLALAEPELSARPETFDRDPWLLCVENGLLDLRTSELQAASPSCTATKIAGVAYDPAATCPTWQAFLARIMANDPEMIAFLRRAVGYTLTGDVSEQCLFFMHGTGANGKSTFVNAVLAMLGDYGRQAAPQLLMSGDRHPTELADLQGARFVATIEIEEGRRLAEVLTKQLTGGDRMKARFTHRDWFEFEPSHKIWLAANHKPVIMGTDYAIWRRIKLIPFSVTIPEPERDPHMLAKLRAELPGILTWAVRGCLEWQRQGLAIPEKVKQATNEYQAAQDTLAAFMDERCIINDLASVTAGKLYEAFKAWAKDAGEEIISQRRFSERLRERGHVTEGRDINGRALYHGLGLRSDEGEGENY